MSGEETLAQVYREVESPKLENFKKAAFIVFVYSLVLTSLISFFAVMIIPDKERVGQFQGNLIGGLAMSVVGPHWARLLLHGLVVFVGFLILSGGVNTAIVGSNGVLERVAEDGVLPDWFLKPHPKYGTTSRVLNLIFGLQLFTIFISGGNVLLLGEAYAFGVIWSFVFMTAAMLMLRFRQPGERAFMVPGNIKVGQYEIPIGLSLVFLVLVAAAVVNLGTKPIATISGGAFSITLFVIFFWAGAVQQVPGPAKTRGGRPPRRVQYRVRRAVLGRSPQPDEGRPGRGRHPLRRKSRHAQSVPRRGRCREDRRGDRGGRRVPPPDLAPGQGAV